MVESARGLQNVIDSSGIDMSITGIVIVYVALGVISLIIGQMPNILKVVNKIFPEPQAPTVGVRTTTMDDATVAAIGLALHHELTSKKN